MVKEIKEQEFKNIVEENKKVVIDCFANWCGPCKMLGPVLEEINSIDVVKVDCDESIELAREFIKNSLEEIIEASPPGRTFSSPSISKVSLIVINKLVLLFL